MDYDTSSLANGVKEGLDQIARTYQNGKIADSIIKVNPEMLGMLGMRDDEFKSLSSQDKSSAITGAITALGIRKAKAQAQQEQTQADEGSANYAAMLKAAAGRAQFNSFIANAPDEDGGQPAGAGGTPDATPAPPNLGAVGMPTAGSAPAQPAMTPQALAAVGMTAPGGAPAQPAMTPGALQQVMGGRAPLAGRQILKAAAQAGVLGDPNVDKVLATMERYDPARFAAGPSQFDSQDIGDGVKLVSKRGSKEFQVIYPSGAMATPVPVLDPDGKPTGQMMIPHGNGKGVTVINPMNTAATDKTKLDSVIEAEMATQGIDKQIKFWNARQTDFTNKVKDAVAQDPSVLQELQARRARIQGMIGSGAVATAQVMTDPKGQKVRVPADQVEAMKRKGYK